MVTVWAHHKTRKERQEVGIRGIGVSVSSRNVVAMQ